MNIKQLLFLTLLSGALLFSSCSEDDDPIPVEINFVNSELALSESAEVEITFSRPADVAGAIAIEITSNLTYGSDSDYYTDPATVEGILTISYEAGDESASFDVFPGETLNIQQDETISFTISDSDGFVLGEGISATVTVSENFVAASGTIEIDGGGSEFPNQAFIDLSKLEQTTVGKYTWDLGFSFGGHQVVLNSSAYVMARALDINDIDAVSASDTVGFAAKMYISNYVDTEASGWVDNQNGDLNDTAIGAISSTDTDNNVYIIKRDGDSRNWKKVRILQDGENYTLQYADIDASSHDEVTISKNVAFNFTHFDLDNGEIEVEPEKENWDLMYSSYTGRANFGVLLAIGYNDYIVINRSGVSAAMVMESEIEFDDFEEADLSTITMVSDNISVIGSSWRSLVDFSLVLNEDVYYVMSDAEGNNYKLKFTRLTSETNERGYPEFTFELL